MLENSLYQLFEIVKSLNFWSRRILIVVSMGLRWLTEILAWEQGWDFVFRVASTVLHRKSDSPPKVENYYILVLFFDF